jgi:hypothetical protein
LAALRQCSVVGLSEADGQATHPGPLPLTTKCPTKCGGKGSGVMETNATSELGFYLGVVNPQWLVRQCLAQTSTICGSLLFPR